MNAVASRYFPRPFREGFADMLAPAPGVLAWGLVTGIAMVKSGLGVGPATLISLTAYAGSAQLATLPLITTGAPLSIVILTAIVMNLRFTVYAASFIPHFGAAGWRQRLVRGYFIADVTTLLFMRRFGNSPAHPDAVPYYWGLVACNWLGWQIGSLMGIFAAPAIPPAWSLEFAGLVALVALVAPALLAPPAAIGATVAAITAVLTHSLPMRSGIVVALLAGSAAAMLYAARAARPGRG
ncbi:MAG: AzlC family ABC transporter permease, partial [Steroidobacteraceae bacterium]|nr:AzlC family ABC transporter permease [Steroidobacteraceae bacterium]